MTRRLVSWSPRHGGAGGAGGAGGDRSTEPPFDPSSWSGALIVMTVFVAALWVVQIVNDAHNLSFNRFGLKPREVDGLWGVVTTPALHLSYGHLLSETVPLAGVGWVVLLSGLRTWLTVSVLVLIIGGLAAWLVAPSGLIVGASGLVFGWIGYLLARAYFTRKVQWIVSAVAVLFFFGTLLTSLLPSFDKHASWQSHACGFLAGVVAAAILHPRPQKAAARSRG